MESWVHHVLFLRKNGESHVIKNQYTPSKNGIIAYAPPWHTVTPKKIEKETPTKIVTPKKTEK